MCTGKKLRKRKNKNEDKIKFKGSIIFFVVYSLVLSLSKLKGQKVQTYIFNQTQTKNII